jgi:hypothetical protein
MSNTGQPHCEYNCEFICELCKEAETRLANEKADALLDDTSDDDIAEAWASYLAGERGERREYPIVKFTEAGTPIQPQSSSSQAWEPTPYLHLQKEKVVLIRSSNPVGPTSLEVGKIVHFNSPSNPQLSTWSSDDYYC